MVLHVVHLVESLHGSDDLSTGHLLVEGEDEAVGARAVVERHRERVELRIEPVGLRAEGETPRHAELRRRCEEGGGGGGGGDMKEG